MPRRSAARGADAATRGAPGCCRSGSGEQQGEPASVPVNPPAWPPARRRLPGRRSSAGSGPWRIPRRVCRASGPPGIRRGGRDCRGSRDGAWLVSRPAERAGRQGVPGEAAARDPGARRPRHLPGTHRRHADRQLRNEMITELLEGTPSGWGARAGSNLCSGFKLIMAPYVHMHMHTPRAIELSRMESRRRSASDCLR
jgi:hypothetical protein